jgi:hypothetical protein
LSLLSNANKLVSPNSVPHNGSVRCKTKLVTVAVDGATRCRQPNDLSRIKQIRRFDKRKYAEGDCENDNGFLHAVIQYQTECAAVDCASPKRVGTVQTPLTTSGSGNQSKPSSTIFSKPNDAHSAGFRQSVELNLDDLSPNRLQIWIV